MYVEGAELVPCLADAVEFMTVAAQDLRQIFDGKVYPPSRSTHRFRLFIMGCSRSKARDLRSKATTSHGRFILFSLAMDQDDSH